MGKMREEIKYSENSNHSLYTKGIQSIDSMKKFENHQRSIDGCPFHRKEIDNGTISSENN